MIRGIAVPTMVWSRAASRSVSKSPVRVPANWRRVRLWSPVLIASLALDIYLFKHAAPGTHHATVGFARHTVRVMRHVFALLVLLALLLFVMARNVSPDPYIYDEADYMFAASQGLWANYTVTPTLPIADFVRTGVARGRDSGARLALSEQIRASNDILFYRHWHGPLYLYCLIPISRAFANEQSVRMALLGISALTLIAIYAGCIWLMPGPRGSLAALLAGLLFASSNSVIRSTELAPHQLFALYFVCCLIFLAKAVDTARRAYWYAAVVFAAVAFCTLEIAFVVILSLAIAGFIERRSL